MTSFNVYTPQNAPEGSKPVLNQVVAALGQNSNLMGVLAESPLVAETTWNFFGALTGQKAALTPVEQHILGIVISRENSCTYCVAAHSTFAAMAQTDETTLDAVRSGKTLKDAKLETLRQTALKMLKTQGWLSEQDMAAFFAAGYTKAHLLEVIAWVALKVITNYTNHIAKTPLDEMFASKAWVKAAA